MLQPTLLDLISMNERYSVKSFSADGICDDSERRRIEEKFTHLIEVTDEFNRQSVSFQLSKKGNLHGWLKYKEGFSEQLVLKLMELMNIMPGDIVLDPFLGSGTTAITAQINGINSIGFDILPMSALAIKAKRSPWEYNTDEMRAFLNMLMAQERPHEWKNKAIYLKITEGAYPSETELDISFYAELIESCDFDVRTKDAARLCLLNCLEDVSFTSKDGQYLRWDFRSEKVMAGNRRRAEKGLPPYTIRLNKGELPLLKNCFIKKFTKMLEDVKGLGRHSKASIEFKQESAITGLPLLSADSIDGVITSPPYCNRYDYTRIYALELAHLGESDESLRARRQELLCCTVENKPKKEFLANYYHSLRRESDYMHVINILDSLPALLETFSSLQSRNKLGQINNKGVLRMVEGYFTELAFIYFELFRVCKPGAMVAFVNDNVRFAGEVVPVDTISTEMAAMIGFKPIVIKTLRQQKGNSSQQMKKYGRVPLRKSITIWQKAN